MRSKIENKIKRKQAEIQIILRRIAPCEAVGKLYEDNNAFIHGLSEFVKEGLKAGDSIVVIATAEHLLALENQLRVDGFNIFYLTLRDQYIPLNADALLEKFLVEGWPDEVLFTHLVMTLAARALKNDRHIRAYSEMAALLWLRGHRAASVQLELIWNKLLQNNKEYDHVKLKSEILPYSSDGTSQPPSFLAS